MQEINNWSRFLEEKHELILNKELDVLYKNNIRPDRKDLYNAFSLCPEAELKIIVLGHSPYPTYHAHGIAFSSAIGWEVPPSLAVIYHAILESVYNNDATQFKSVSDFTVRYKDSGILWLNRQLTTVDRVAGDNKSKSIWNSFIISLIKYIAEKYKEVIWLIMTKESKDVYEFLNKRGIKAMLVSHPASSLYNNKEWYYDDCFNQVNTHLRQLNKTEIVW